MIELIQINNPIVVIGNPIPKGNTTIDYRLKNVPAEKIKNLTMRQKKKRWDDMLRYQSRVAYACRMYAKRVGWVTPDKTANIAIAVEYRFECTKYKNPAFVKTDLENAQKLIGDAIEDSGIILNDKQICFQLLEKTAVEKGKGAVVIYSLAVLENGRLDFDKWLSGLN